MTLNCRGQLIDLSVPLVMGILNLSSDSFYDGGKIHNESSLLQQAEKMLKEGAAILDVGGMSSRPGAVLISEKEELGKVLPALTTIREHFPEALLSIDTIRAKVANEAMAIGASIVNDISAGRLDEAMLLTVAKHRAVFIAMHMKGMPADMQIHPEYHHVLNEVMDFFAERISACHKAGIVNIVIDPGFCFGKNAEHNYTLLRNLRLFQEFNLPVMAGLSRKSMIGKVLGVTPDKALNGTTAAHTIALLNGANLLRVHDVKEAVEAVKIVQATAL